MNNFYGSVVNSSFSPDEIIKFDGQWTYQKASHLLRRTIFGPTYLQIKESENIGLDDTIDLLLTEKSALPLPINFYFTSDPEVPVGETWVGKKMDGTVSGLVQSRNASLSAWIVNLMYDRNINISEKMMLFWHNHLVISDISDPNAKYSYITTLRKYALGNFKKLVRDITIDPGMLEYLNGNENTALAPNENYARELLELFTIGKGPLAGQGDYTNYTETDVREIARCLSGWTIDRTLNKGVFKVSRHDQGEKKLSHRFGNISIKNSNEEEYKKVIDVIFQQNEVARFICRQLYIWFVNSDISPATEQELIIPLAQILIENDYEVSPVLRALLSSQHFFDECNTGIIIKSPADFVMTLINSGSYPIPDDIIQKYLLSNYINQNYFRKMDQAWFAIPSVAGWKAYYQEPVYYKYWLSSVSLPQRNTIVNDLTYKKIKVGDKKYGLDLLILVAQFDHPEDPVLLIKSLSDLFLPYDLTQEQYDYLKSEVLLPGLGDYVWSKEYNEYLQNQSDANLKETVNKRLQNLCSVILNLPENQLL
ncbi:MAG: DUF1800 domain-containing protein [Saprospiraceae bacterium]|nr:DUF1800 domain-containing protein [Saprospiraceae bacterium]